MVLQGVKLLFYPTAIVSEPKAEGLDSRDHWKRVMQGHAVLVPLESNSTNSNYKYPKLTIIEIERDFKVDLKF
ncbi:hypothetical protein L2E82_35572 [Cichorium intybus]|uniref:Uncharacterized protein n=1 Tax=Cichorium intybus TaxID=13427 RepID=A0ACB9BP76_CICIN|nr:hypothetical protein L2E82_35572 [Cichorium intybus]